MDIIKYLENAKSQIRADEERQIALIRNAINQEVVSFNQEVDKVKNENINKLSLKFVEDKNAISASFNEQISAITNKFEEDKNAVNEAAAKKKLEHLNSLLATRTYEITSVCDKAIAQLNSQIEELKR